MQRFDGARAAPLRHGALLALALLAIAARFAAAQEPDDATASRQEGLPRYTVELIVFTYAGGATGSSEIFVPEVPPGGYAGPEEGTPGPPVFSDRPSEPLSEPGTGETTTVPGDPAAPDDREISGIDEDLADIPLRTRIELHRLPPEQYSMNEIYDKLVELDAYHPIMRAAWTQTTPPEESSPSIRLRALGDPPPGLDGTVKLYQGRFVHLGLDVALHAGEVETRAAGVYDERQSATDRAIAASGRADDRTPDEPPGVTGPAWGDGAFGPYDDSVALPVRYRISEVRIIREGDIRYYDHPRFGVIAKLTKVEEEATQDIDGFAGGD